MNDCSKDSSLDILSRYEQLDSRVKVVDLPHNSGAAGARNHALADSSGEYIAFVDIDDWVDHDRYERLFNYARQFDVDAVLDGFVYNNDKGDVKAKKPLTDRLRFVSGAQMIKEMFFGNISAFAPWHGIYKRRVIGNCQFQPIRGDDAIFNLDFYARANKICLTPELAYHFRELDSSETRGYRPPESVGSLHGVEACAAYLRGNRELKRLVHDFDFITDYHLLGEYATVARNVCEKDCPESFEQRKNFLCRIANSHFFRSACENKEAMAHLSGRKRCFLSLLYNGHLTSLTGYMYLKSKWKKVEELFK